MSKLLAPKRTGTAAKIVVKLYNTPTKTGYYVPGMYVKCFEPAPKENTRPFRTPQPFIRSREPCCAVLIARCCAKLQRVSGACCAYMSDLAGNLALAQWRKNATATHKRGPGAHA